MRIDTKIQTKFKAGASVFMLKKSGERFNVGTVVKIRLEQERAVLQYLVELDNGERKWIDEKRLHEEREHGGYKINVTLETKVNIGDRCIFICNWEDEIGRVIKIAFKQERLRLAYLLEDEEGCRKWVLEDKIFRYKNEEVSKTVDSLIDIGDYLQ